jgi:hypothetical protein
MPSRQAFSPFKSLRIQGVTIRVAVATAFLATVPALAPAAEVATLVADGKPWKATRADGGTMTLTLNPDGTGKIQMAIMSRPVRWRPAPNGFCLGGLPNGEKCVVLKKTTNGYRASENGVPMLSLSR